MYMYMITDAFSDNMSIQSIGSLIASTLSPSLVFSHWWMGLFVALAVYFFGFLTFKILSAKFKKLTEKTQTDLDDLLIDSLHFPMQFFLAFASFFLFLSLSPEVEKFFPQRQMVQRAFFTFWVFWVLWRLTSAFFHSQFTMKWSDGPRQVFRIIIRFVIFSMGLLFILDAFGISITPLLASLGVGSLAVALALQDTLGNFFGGIYLWLDKPVQIGDFVRIDKDVEGVVTKIGWRSSQIKMTNNSMLILPNSKLSSSQLINFSIVDPETILVVPMGISYGSDLENAEKVILEVAKNVQAQILGAVPEFDPLIRYTTFADSAIQLNVILKSKTVTDQHVVRHEFIKLVHRRLAEVGIEMPFPQTVIHMAQSSSSLRS